MVLASAGPADAKGPVLVIAPNAAHHVVQAEGRLIGPTIAPLAALATGPDGFLDQLSKSDIWFAIDGEWVAKICGVNI
ncbi:MAG: hypothetical protein OXD48_11560 [Litoreibacter sp.]|nr:hypothetical protein [Litoreibacter sp.]